MRLGLGSPKPFRHRANDKEAEAFIKAAYDLGIDFFDTAPAYGSEHNLAVLKPVRDKVRISTKSPHRLGIRQGWKTLNQRLTKSFENSLRALQTDYVDFYFLHAVTLNVLNKLPSDTFELFDRWKQQGKVKFIGVSEDIPHDPYHKVFQPAYYYAYDRLMLKTDNRPWSSYLASFFGVIGMSVGGPVLPWHLEKYDIVLTGTSNIDHLAQNIHTARMVDLGKKLYSSKEESGPKGGLSDLVTEKDIS